MAKSLDVITCHTLCVDCSAEGNKSVDLAFNYFFFDPTSNGLVGISR